MGREEFLGKDSQIQERNSWMGTKHQEHQEDTACTHAKIFIIS